MEAQVLASVAGFPLADGSTLSAQVRQGEVVRIVGPNGSGKTSLLRSLAGLEAALVPTTAGTFAEVVYVPQSARDALIGLTVAGEFRLRQQSFPASLHGLAERDVATLSHGEARQVATHLGQGGLLLLDEPSEGLDAHNLNQVLTRVQAHKGAVIVVDHDGSFASVATRTIHLGEDEPPTVAPIRSEPGNLVVQPAGPVVLDGRTVQVPQLNIGPGLHVLKGPNGCGKSTLLAHLAQRYPMARWLPERAMDLLDAGSVQAQLAGSEPGVVAGLMGSRLDARHPMTLSGGELQRLALAATLGIESPLYLLDEPDIHLDSSGRQELLRILRQLADRGACILVASHDPAVASAGRSIQWENP